MPGTRKIRKVETMPRLTLLQLNDLHGYAEPHNEIRYGADGAPVFETPSGLARIKTIFERARADHPGGVLPLDNGDTFHGTHFAVSDEAKALVPLGAELGFDAMTPHWEFAFGPADRKSVGEGKGGEVR